MIDVLNPKIFAGVNARWKWFHFYAGASAGYAHYIGKPIGGFLETVRLGANYAYENRANEFIHAYRKAMRPRSGYSLGLYQSITFFITRHIGIDAAMQFDYIRLRDPKVAEQPTRSDIYNTTETIGIKYTFGKIKVKPAKTDKQ